MEVAYFPSRPKMELAKFGHEWRDRYTVFCICKKVCVELLIGNVMPHDGTVFFVFFTVYINVESRGVCFCYYLDCR